MSVDTLLQRADIWRGGQTSSTAYAGVGTGFAELDEVFPGGGWPLGALTEIFTQHRGIGELSLLMPALARLSQEEPRWIAWIAPPYIPYAPALLAHGVDLSRVLWVHPRAAQDSLWALEQALRSGTCSAVLAWPEGLDSRSLRRLQLAAEVGQSLGLLFCAEHMAEQSSPAALRLQLSPALGGVDVTVLKRRGGWATGPVHVPLAHAASNVVASVA
ncbi:MAG TPA: translesion DNA synthesis-associated protein ImuA [Chromatiaceae bacterium]|nr:translesion DNA synthesis-associated protein ImuA [Chromatiaceae bacterium]HIN81665.1 translesion DNA synthesis-associated protein ImuA [Chromatiales bacterium]HIA08569.1 translesion DNA synthesis-associated protein ImuA [Chromatiaceae bacterium]HIB84386.1 translesion DNA synthesis-associated protein ImuA [Chromatiaceae bacterium]HIO14976.1 translesion DNA synthesis-associated protein ImuA [Chromatiales bacterium]